MAVVGSRSEDRNAASSSLWEPSQSRMRLLSSVTSRRPRGKAGLPRRPRTTGRSSRRPAGRSGSSETEVEHIESRTELAKSFRDTAEGLELQVLACQLRRAAPRLREVSKGRGDQGH